MILNYAFIVLFSTSIFCLLFHFYKQQKKQRQLKQWKLNLKAHYTVFEKLYAPIDGFSLSKQARIDYDVLDYIYGEIEFFSFIALLSLIELNKNSVFYDLGSGTGKAVLACAMVYPVQKSVGIEILPELYNASCAQAQCLTALPPYKDQEIRIQFVLGDFLKNTLQEATVVFVNSSTLFGETWGSLCQVLNELSQLEIVITTSKPLISARFSPQISTNIQMSWGIVPAFIHFQKNNFSKPIENIE